MSYERVLIGEDINGNAIYHELETGEEYNNIFEEDIFDSSLMDEYRRLAEDNYNDYDDSYSDEY